MNGLSSHLLLCDHGLYVSLNAGKTSRVGQCIPPGPAGGVLTHTLLDQRLYRRNGGNFPHGFGLVFADFDTSSSAQNTHAATIPAHVLPNPSGQNTLDDAVNCGRWAIMLSNSKPHNLCVNVTLARPDGSTESPCLVGQEAAHVLVTGQGWAIIPLCREHQAPTAGTRVEVQWFLVETPFSGQDSAGATLGHDPATVKRGPLVGTQEIVIV